MKKLYIVLISSCIFSYNSFAGKSYQDVAEIEDGNSDLSLICEELHEKHRFFLSKEEKNAMEQCAFLNDLLQKTKNKGSCQETLGLGFEKAIEEYYKQSEEDQKFTAKIRTDYLESDRNSGKKIIKKAINDVLRSADYETNKKEYSQFKKTADKNVVTYVQNFKKKKIEKSEKKAKERTRGKF